MNGAPNIICDIYCLKLCILMRTQLMRTCLSLVFCLPPAPQVLMFEPRSYLQKLADPWVHPAHLERAAGCDNPLERMKLTVTW